MINPILEFSVRQRLLVLLATAILIGFGILALKQIPIDAFPDVTNVQVQVLVTAGGMSPPEIEKLVTRPIEIELAGLPRLTEIRSVSKIGLSAITVVFEDGVNDYFARQLVFERLQGARDKLPAGVEAELGPITTGLGEIFQYTLVSKDKKHDATELRTIQDYIVRPILRTVPGVTDVNSFGGLVKQYQVLVNPDRLTSSGITVAQVFEALEKNNTNASGNYIEHKSEQYVVRGLGLVNNESDIANIIVATHEHAPIYVRDLAEVKIGAELRQGAVTANGQGEAVAGIVHDAQRSERARRSERCKGKITGIQKALPNGVELVPFYDRTDLVKKAVNTVTKALARRSDLCARGSHYPSRRCSQCDNCDAGPPTGRALRLHHDEMVRPERESDVPRRARHRHRHDGRWRGRDGGKHSSASDGKRDLGDKHRRSRQDRNRALCGEGGRPADRLRHIHYHHRIFAAVHARRI